VTSPTERRRRRHRLGAQGLAAVVAVAATLALTGGPAVAEADWLAGCGPRQAGTVRVALVLDFGAEPDAPEGIEVACVVVPEGSRGDDVLVGWARARGQGIRIGSSGLVCGIAGYPGGTACGVQTETGYLYWSFWYDGPAGWTYGSIGPAASPVCDGSVQGWRFQRGSGRPVDPPPRVTMPTATGCGAPTAPSTTSTVLTTEPIPATGTPAPADASPYVPAAPPAALPSSSSSTTAPGSAGGASDAAVTTAPTATPLEPEHSATTPTEVGATPTDGASAAADAGDVQLTQASLGTPSSSTSMLPTVFGVVLIGGLGIVAAMRFRRGAAT